MYLKHLRPHQLHEAIAQGAPLLVPAGCIETHGPHLALGHDTLLVEAVCRRLAERVPVVIAPSVEYGPTGYAVAGPEDGTIDVDNASFAGHIRSVLEAFLEMGFSWIIVPILHQGMEAPLALAFRRAAAELAFERTREQRGRGWWGARRPTEAESQAVWGRVHVRPLILPTACPPCGGDHAGYFETSLLLATHPEMVDQSRLDASAPWYCFQEPGRNAATATAAAGQAMLAALVDAWVDELASLTPSGDRVSRR